MCSPAPPPPLVLLLPLSGVEVDTQLFFFVFMAAAVIVIEFLHVKVSKFTFCVMCSVKFSSQKLLYKTEVNRRCHI